MQNKQQEIEIKIKIKDEDLELLKDWLESNAEYVDEFHQVDYYLDNPDSSFIFEDDGFIDSIDYLRVRISDKRDSTCFKHWYEDPEKPGSHTHCDENETAVADGEALLKLYEALGYTNKTAVDKIRKK